MAAVIGTGVQIAGKYSRISAEGTALAMAKGNVVFVTQDLDTTNFNSVFNGVSYLEGISAPVGLTWTLGGGWDAGTIAYDDPPGLYPRDDLPNLLFYLNVALAQGYTMPFARVRSSTTNMDVKGLVTFDSAGMSQGPFVVPG
jgi:hypothetical protein